MVLPFLLSLHHHLLDLYSLLLLQLLYHFHHLSDFAHSSLGLFSLFNICTILIIFIIREICSGLKPLSSNTTPPLGNICTGFKKYGKQINFVYLWLILQAIGFIFPIHFSEQIYYKKTPYKMYSV
mgnify:CR=1 FL=1